MFAGGVYLIFFALLLILYRAQLNRAVKLNIRRMSEAGASSFSYTTTFEPEAVKTVNHTTGAETLIKYGDIVRVEETRRVLLIFSNGGLFLLAFKDKLVPAQYEELKSFLKERIGRR